MDMASSPRTVEEIFKDYGARRTAVIRALTHDVDEFYGLCDPDKDNLCLYGHPNEAWEVTLPAEEVPPELPEPALGINFARDGMNRRDWLSLVAVHSDSWLVSVAFYLGARLNRNERKKSNSSLGPSTFSSITDFRVRNLTFDKNPMQSSALFPSPSWPAKDFLSKVRKRLFSLINDLPSVFEVVTDRKPVKDKPTADSGSKSRGSAKRSSDEQVKSNPKFVDEGYEEDEDEHNETLCGSCGGNYNADEFWICCDICERWFHGKCVKITPAKAESIKQYKCPSCSLRRGRP
ncbi:PHD finger protein ALFIN-LIKE 1 isoform C [Glycine soja]|uniref:PHD finger protein ALFIN-LIKE n=1 Tax=Glycine soja TaxID=3848 RepID=A0A445FVR4_GLYSO|nr:PHD finger protein ALFIN-LIKE 1 isoform A [Glycine soja]RZB52862.1 PHD finger protein ALFIN-LIKE 1 isoform B [Glycine soja]RZB52863.1 PHD finger protein ALFIN-LIKE 1 isoform C [Glycine soja]